MNKVSKDLDVIVIGAAIVDLPLRPVSKEVFDVVSYPVDGIAMTIGGDALMNRPLLQDWDIKLLLMSCIGVDVAGAFVLSLVKERESIQNISTRSGNRYFDHHQSGSD